MGKWKALDFPRYTCQERYASQASVSSLPAQNRKGGPQDNEAHFPALFTSSFLNVTRGCPGTGWVRESSVCLTSTAWRPAMGQSKRETTITDFLKPGSTTQTPGPLLSNLPTLPLSNWWNSITCSTSECSPCDTYFPFADNLSFLPPVTQ